IEPGQGKLGLCASPFEVACEAGQKLIGWDSPAEPARPLLHEYGALLLERLDRFVGIRSGLTDRLRDPVAGRGRLPEQKSVDLGFEARESERDQDLGNVGRHAFILARLVARAT